MTMITHPSLVVPEPELWMEYESSSEVSTIAHRRIGGGTVYVVGPVTPRRVRVALLYPAEADAQVAEQAHRISSGPFTITEDGRPSLGMTYIVAGQISRKLDPETASVWIVAVDVEQIA